MANIRRKSSGKFAKGNRGGTGNPKLRTYHTYRNLLLEIVSEDDFREIAIKLVELAKDGESWAVKDFFDRILGKPKQQVEVESAMGGVLIAPGAKTPEQWIAAQAATKASDDNADSDDDNAES